MDEQTTSEPVRPQDPSVGRGPFRLCDWLVEPSLNRLTRGQETSQLQPKIMDVLVCLARRSGEVVSKSDILDEVWQQEHVADSVLANAVASLRSELGDDARRPRYIETIAKRGYRLLAPVEPLVRPAELPRAGPMPSPSKHGRAAMRNVWAAAATAAAVGVAATWLGFRSWHDAFSGNGRSATPPRIVVIPFENLGQPDDDHIAAGFTEEITHRLARISSLQVISRTTALNYDRSGKTIPQIGRDLDVDFVLEGSVRWQRSPDGAPSFRVTPQLIRVADDSHLWSATFDRSPEELFAVQSEISQRIVNELDVSLLESEQAAVNGIPMRDIDTYQLFLLGRSYLLSAETSDYLDAVDLFEQVIERAPRFVPAHARLSEAHGLLFLFSPDTGSQHLEAARAAVERARELGPDLPEVHRALGLYHYRCRHDFETALQELDLARSSLPNDGEILAAVAYIERRQGRWDESLATLSRALELDPLNASHLWNMASTLSMMRRWSEAELMADSAIAAAPGMATPHIVKTYTTLRATGDVQRARAVFEAAPIHPDEPLWQEWRFNLAFLERRWEEAVEAATALTGPSRDLLLCSCYVRMGRQRDAAQRCRAAISVLEQQEQSGGTGLSAAMMSQGLAYGLTAQPDLAVEHADRGFEIELASGDAVEIAIAGVARAAVYSTIGEADAAVRQLEHLLAAPAPLSARGLAVDPVWDPIRDHPGFQRLVAKGSEE